MNWVKQYEYHGDRGFMKKNYTNYSAQFKLDVLNYMSDNGTSPNETAVIFNISSPATIRAWRIQFETARSGRPQIKEKGASIHEKRRQKKQKNKLQLKDLSKHYKPN